MCVIFGWVQAVAISAFGIATVVALACIVEQELDNRHERKLKRMEHKQEVAIDTIEKHEETAK